MWYSNNFDILQWLFNALIGCAVMQHPLMLLTTAEDNLTITKICQ